MTSDSSPKKQLDPRYHPAWGMMVGGVLILCGILLGVWLVSRNIPLPVLLESAFPATYWSPSPSYWSPSANYASTPPLDTLGRSLRLPQVVVVEDNSAHDALSVLQFVSLDGMTTNIDLLDTDSVHVPVVIDGSSVIYYAFGQIKQYGPLTGQLTTLFDLRPTLGANTKVKNFLLSADHLTVYLFVERQSTEGADNPTVISLDRVNTYDFSREEVIEDVGIQPGGTMRNFTWVDYSSFSFETSYGDAGCGADRLILVDITDAKTTDLINYTACAGGLGGSLTNEGTQLHAFRPSYGIALGDQLKATTIYDGTTSDKFPSRVEDFTSIKDEGKITRFNANGIIGTEEVDFGQFLIYLPSETFDVDTQTNQKLDYLPVESAAEGVIYDGQNFYLRAAKPTGASYINPASKDGYYRLDGVTWVEVDRAAYLAAVKNDLVAGRHILISTGETLEYDRANDGDAVILKDHETNATRRLLENGTYEIVGIIQ